MQHGSGILVYKITRPGSLDKLYNPEHLGPYYKAARDALTPIVDDHLPLKVLSGRLVKVRHDGSLIQEEV